MTKLPLILCVTCAVIVAGGLTWKAEATPLTGSASSLAVIKGFSAVQKAGCVFGTHRCPAGTKWSCTHFSNGKKCVCRTC